ncbi:hypothetical protein CO2235_U670068 [Cupriavidus oxalaticus]|uniref:Uncharacterized protein n=1 Tax=Cupriavidus oxalaticus TaxID=96344 RepID=A0A375FL75_9BURK|nr:hypothetical protein CO2235_U670068 [Cupriavidus oxalaticus]
MIEWRYFDMEARVLGDAVAVSYTHLDVYKRQRHDPAPAGPARAPWPAAGAYPLLRVGGRPPQADHADQYRRRQVPVG